MDFTTFMPQAMQDMRADTNMLIQRDWAQDDAETAWRRGQENMLMSQDFNSAEAVKAREFTERMSSTAWQRGVKDMQAAGLNPMLAYMKGGSDTGGSSMASSSALGVSPATLARGESNSGNAGVNSAMMARLIAEKENVEADTDVKRKTAGEIWARTPTHAVSMDKMRQEIEESKQKVDRMIVEMSAIRQGESTSAAQERVFNQNVSNMKEMVVQIRATVNNLKASTSLTGAHEKEVRQRVAANLPRIEGIVKDLEAKAREFSMPSHANKAAAAESFVGLLGEYARALNPFRDLFK